jgi:hypothetical protein
VMETKTPAEDAVGKAIVNKATTSIVSSRFRIECVLILFTFRIGCSDSGLLDNPNTLRSNRCVVWT